MSGSPTSTGWKRRSSAASFSMCLRYSSSVVAPTARSSPRASIGFKRLAASTAPSAAPAPTLVWSSLWELVKKGDALPPPPLPLFHPRFQPPLDLPAFFRARQQRADFERDHPPV